MWENIKFFASLFGALLIAHMTLLVFLWPKDHDIISMGAKYSILIFPVSIISLSIYAALDLRRRWDRFLLISAQLCKLEDLLGLHKDIGEKLTFFKEDKFLFKDYRTKIKYANSDHFRKKGKKWIKSNTYTSMLWIYWITIALGIALLGLDIFLLTGVTTS